MKRLFKPNTLEYDFRTMANPTRPAPKLPDTLTPDEVPVSNPNNLTSVYANHFGASATIADFTMYFLELGQIPGPSGPIFKQELKAAITLPMITIAGLINVLQQVQNNNKAQLVDLQKQMESGR